GGGGCPPPSPPLPPAHQFIPREDREAVRSRPRRVPQHEDGGDQGRTIVQPFSPSSISVTTPAFTRSALSTSGGSLPSLRAIDSRVFSHAMNETFGIPCLNDLSLGFTGEVSSRSM